MSEITESNALAIKYLQGEIDRLQQDIGVAETKLQGLRSETNRVETWKHQDKLRVQALEATIKELKERPNGSV